MAAVALAAALLLSLPFLFVLARRPVLRRLALRNAARRPREALLVVVGSMMGAAIITGSLVVGDTLSGSIRQMAKAHLGPVDEIVLTRDGSRWWRAAAALTTLPARDVDGVLQLQTLDVATVAGSGPTLRSAPRAQLVGVDFPAARRFGGEPTATGIAGPTPAAGHAAITTDLARALGLRPGGRLDVYAYGRKRSLVVDRILPRRGIAGFWLRSEQESRNVLVSPLTLASLTAPSALLGERVAQPDSIVAVSNRGGVENAAGLTAAVTREIEARTGGFDAQVIGVKKLTLEQADKQGKSFTDLYSGMGTFGVLAGLLLLINLFVMLAAERKSELGMARAVGMRRSWLVGAFATEGWLYALAASLLGTAAGVGLGRLIIVGSQRMFNTKHSQFDLFFTVRPASIAIGFAIGFVIALVTVVAMSVRVSRLNIIRAIRDLPEPPRTPRRRWLVVGAAAIVVGVLWTVTALPKREPFGLLLGPMLVAAGFVPLFGRLYGRRLVLSAASALIIGWGVSVFVFFADAADQASIMVWVAQGVTLTAAAVVLVATQQERVAVAIKRLVPGRKLSLSLGLAYPLARRSRTGLTVAMYALVVFILVFITTLSSMIGSSVDKTTTQLSGGYQAIVSSSAANPLPASTIASLPGVRRVASLERTTAQFQPAGKTDETPWNLTAFAGDFLAGGPPQLQDRGAYRSDTAAWRAVLHDPRLVIVDADFLQTTGGPGTPLAKVGDRYAMIDPFSGARRTVTVAAIAHPDALIQNGAFYGAAGARSLLGERLVPNRAYVALAAGTSPDAFASSTQAAYVAHGAEAYSIRSITEEAFGIWNAMFQLFQGYLGLGLVVGIAGLAVVMVRAVRERRRQIGMLRALGFGWRPVGSSFAIEAGYVAVEGTLIGALLALLTIFNIVANTDVFGDMRFTVPWAQLGILLGGTLFASLVATALPSISAARIKPAVALRITD
jgi:putative ABC transport system permease protein